MPGKPKQPQTTSRERIAYERIAYGSDRPRRRVVMAEMRPLKEADRSFDRRFWKRVGARGRWAAMSDMIREVYLIQGWMDLHRDYEEMLSELSNANVRFLVVGALRGRVSL